MMTMTNNYTIFDALTEISNGMQDGEKMLGYKICSIVRGKMSQHNTGKRPMDTSILRCLRKHRSELDLNAKAIGCSEYTKGTQS